MAYRRFKQRRRPNTTRKGVGHKSTGRKPKFRVAKSLGNCEDCREEIMFVRYIKPPFNWAPLDLKRHDDANIRLRGDYYEIVPPADVPEFRRQGTQLFMNHLVVCPAKKAATNPS